MHMHHRVCPKKPDNRYMVVAFTTTGEPNTMPPPTLYGWRGPPLVGCTYYPAEETERYNSSRITAFAYRVYQGEHSDINLVSNCYGDSGDGLGERVHDDEIKHALVEFMKDLGKCSFLVIHNDTRESSIIASELIRAGLNNHVQAFREIWRFSTMDLGLRSDILIPIRRSLSDFHWKLFGTHIDEDNVKEKLNAMAKCFIDFTVPDPDPEDDPEDESEDESEDEFADMPPLIDSDDDYDDKKYKTELRSSR